MPSYIYQQHGDRIVTIDFVTSLYPGGWVRTAAAAAADAMHLTDSSWNQVIIAYRLMA